VDARRIIFKWIKSTINSLFYSMLSSQEQSDDLMLGARAVSALSHLLTKHKIPPSHGIGHAMRVMSHAHKALAQDIRDGKPKLPLHEHRAVLLAALLHDADDKGFTTENYANARAIIQQALAEIHMVKKSLVPASR
jgi:hypothetical protein